MHFQINSIILCTRGAESCSVYYVFISPWRLINKAVISFKEKGIN